MPLPCFCHRQDPETINNQGPAIVEDGAELISRVDASASTFPTQDEQQGVPRPGRPQISPAVSPRERTRLRVQRHRDQQHLTRAQQIVQWFAGSQELLPPTSEFSALTLHDDIACPSVPDEVQAGPDYTIPDDQSEPEPEAEAILISSSSNHYHHHPSVYVEEDNDGDGASESFGFDNFHDAVPDASPNFTRHGSQSPQRRSSTLSSAQSPPVSSSSSSSDPYSISSVGGDEPILSGYLQAISEQDIAGGPDFLRAQSDVYNRVLGDFFNHQCSCPNSRERAEPENTHTLQEHVEPISRSLPPLPAIFAESDQACDPRASFPQWHSFLSDQPTEPLSFRKTQASLSQDAVTVARQWDVDSIWLGAKSLSAIRAPNQFRLSFFPPHKSNISTNQVIQPHGLDLAHTRHTCIGSFTTAGVRFSAFVFSPNGARSQTRASASSLSLARFRDLYDEIILPAVYETVPDHARQEVPSSYDLIYAKSRAYQEKPGAGRWSAEDESRAFRLAYDIPASALPYFWASIVEKANLHRVQTRQGEDVAYFQNPRLLFQSHDLKNVFARPSLQESLTLFRDTVLAGLDPNNLDIHSCWLDVGIRGHVSRPPSPSLPQNTQGSPEPWTLLWRSDCCRHLHGKLQGLAPEAPLDAKYYRSFLLRDAGTYYAKARPSRASNPGHPDARSPGIIRDKAYNCSKDLFGVMFSDYQLFSSGHLPLLAFDEGMLKDLAGMDQNRQRAFAPQLNRSHLLHAWPGLQSGAHSS